MLFESPFQPKVSCFTSALALISVHRNDWNSEIALVALVDRALGVAFPIPHFWQLYDAVRDRGSRGKCWDLVLSLSLSCPSGRSMGFAAMNRECESEDAVDEVMAEGESARSSAQMKQKRAESRWESANNRKKTSRYATLGMRKLELFTHTKQNKMWKENEKAHSTAFYAQIERIRTQRDTK